MRNHFSLALALVATLSSTLVLAIPPALVTNGCGSGRFSFLVPNKTIISNCNFVDSCNNHDLCYGKCLEGGSLAGDHSCDISKEKDRRRQVCDISLQQDIIKVNPNKPLCSMYASIYRFAVQKMGEEYFHGVQGGGIAVKLNEFLEFVDENPDIFDPADVEQAFESINRPGLNGPDYLVNFQPGIPRLFVLHNDKLILDVYGKKVSK